MSSTPLFDRCFEPGEISRSVSVGAALRDRGIEAALEKAERVKASYIEACLEAIKEFPKGAMITSEDVREKAGDPPSEINASVLAGIMTRAAGRKHALLMITGETRTAKRASVHAKKLSVWLRI